ncbi:predicted protein [Plenodomus lingam JN3]|uniref:Predicted protein n=1 Tax=Leptosphaeria maculans (strain JN3 / isolate v23.1.3 / race Av1-4-5-6-7-8) TaxID=985895 RepID=E4ZQW8_LEPMJ|nr:predicted protein [Plenodomus lingam JN3]CBX94123.1 predicted protein [Plenodomus lingam JN3]
MPSNTLYRPTSSCDWAADDDDDFDFEAWKANADASAPSISELGPLQPIVGKSQEDEATLTTQYPTSLSSSPSIDSNTSDIDINTSDTDTNTSNTDSNTSDTNSNSSDTDSYTSDTISNTSNTDTTALISDISSTVNDIIASQVRYAQEDLVCHALGKVPGLPAYPEMSYYVYPNLQPKHRTNYASNWQRFKADNGFDCRRTVVFRWSRLRIVTDVDGDENAILPYVDEAEEVVQPYVNTVEAAFKPYVDEPEEVIQPFVDEPETTFTPFVDDVEATFKPYVDEAEDVIQPCIDEADAKVQPYSDDDKALDVTSEMDIDDVPSTTSSSDDTDDSWENYQAYSDDNDKENVLPTHSFPAKPFTSDDMFYGFSDDSNKENVPPELESYGHRTFPSDNTVDDLADAWELFYELQECIPEPLSIDDIVDGVTTEILVDEIADETDDMEFAFDLVFEYDVSTPDSDEDYDTTESSDAESLSDQQPPAHHPEVAYARRNLSNPHNAMDALAAFRNQFANTEAMVDVFEDDDSSILLPSYSQADLGLGHGLLDNLDLDNWPLPSAFSDSDDDDDDLSPLPEVDTTPLAQPKPTTSHNTTPEIAIVDDEPLEANDLPISPTAMIPTNSKSRIPFTPTVAVPVTPAVTYTLATKSQTPSISTAATNSHGALKHLLNGATVKGKHDLSLIPGKIAGSTRGVLGRIWARLYKS